MLTNRVAVLDSAPVVVAGLTCELSQKELEVVDLSNCDSLLNALDENPGFSALVIDPGFQNLHGLELIQEVRRLRPKQTIVSFALEIDSTMIARSLCYGVHYFAFKSDSAASLANVVEAATQNLEIDPPPEVSRVIALMQRKREAVVGLASTLTPREMQTLRTMALGLSNREIGMSFGISIETVKEHVQNVLRKLEFRDRTQAAVWAVRQQLV